MALRYDPPAAVLLIKAQSRTLQDWLDRTTDQNFENEVVALVHHLRAAQVRATLEALDEFHRLAVSRSASAKGEGLHA